MIINENKWPDTIQLGSPAADNYVRAYKYHDLPKFHDRQEARKIVQIVPRGKQK